MYYEMLKQALKEEDAEMEEVVEEILKHLKEKDKCKYLKMYFKTYESAYGKKLNEEMAKEWVHSMRPYAEHWTKEQTDTVLKNQGLSVNEIDFYVAMNMMYNDYSKVFENKDISEEKEMKTYIKLAYYFIKDEDFGEGKVFECYKMVMFNDAKKE